MKFRYSAPAVMVAAVIVVVATVSRLLGLNYTALAIGLIITVAFYRYRLPARWFGPYVQEQMFRFLARAFPVVFIALGLGFVAIAAA